MSTDTLQISPEFGGEVLTVDPNGSPWVPRPTRSQRHLAGKHDQKTHGAGGGGSPSVLAVSGHGPFQIEDFTIAHQTPNPAAVQRSVAQVESKIRDKDYETTVAIMPDGAQVWGPKGSSDLSEIPTLAHNRAAVVTHNHPGPDISFSEPDLTSVVGRSTPNMREQRVVSRDADYSIRPGPSGWGSREDYIDNAVATKFHMGQAAFDGRPGINHAYFTELAPRMGWTYTRTERQR